MILRIAASTNGALDNIEYCYAVTRLGRDPVMTADQPRHTPPPPPRHPRPRCLGTQGACHHYPGS